VHILSRIFCKQARFCKYCEEGNVRIQTKWRVNILTQFTDHIRSDAFYVISPTNMAVGTECVN